MTMYYHTILISTVAVRYPMATGRRQAQNRVNSLPVTVTIDRELLDWLESRVDSRMFANRSHAVNRSIGFLKWALENHPELFYGKTTQPQGSQPAQPSRQQQPGTDQRFPR